MTRCYTTSWDLTLAGSHGFDALLPETVGISV